MAESTKKQKLVVRGFALSLDGFSSASGQSLESPFGNGGLVIMEWAFQTRTMKTMFGQEGGSTGIDDSFLAKGFDNIGANILGRNMFGPVRGPWPDEEWKGWWGPNPPYHSPVFVVTHHARAPLPMEGGTTFHFVTDGIESALQQAFAAAEGKDVRLGGGATLVRQYLKAGLIDELHLVMTNKLLGSGERLFDGTDNLARDYDCVETVGSETVTHVRLAKRKRS
ncbi:dihydrofolate reductase family protein [Candidatus Aalborgicola defluviihabitans]|jgi:dihydrofolate reductase|uniref:dihydrofolate reductase family protein n=1 Tax=Candidatus Aalborgicola defluviihabitans TaxID=3386187 RepID=UPI001DEC9E66|nr:dihydrofolate reductase [Burkholderiales bacterium]MBK6570588.1 dihydrofolate reductase [Burkholderiales bacterium]MBK7279584.1 dihydrofolate reductase [Burkholderiales bacterium]MBK7312724.1 dihydrofolate reductase [Burkholderiales bacterium]MBL0243542.1 dihydrofolate reductase [Rhodoferax sp.]